VDKLIKDDGQLHVEGKLSTMVDEFPRNGNLLDGEATVSCLVRKRPEWHPAEPNLIPLGIGKLNHTLANMFRKRNFSARFGCTQPGCVAETVLEVGESMLNRTCKLTVKISQTDFDGDMGTHEQVDFLKVNGRAVKENVRPGRNPCKDAADLGQPPPDAPQLLSGDIPNMSGDADQYSLAVEVDVSEEAKTGKITVTSKISDMVDECGYQGLLLSGIAIVQCEIDEQQQRDIEAVLHRTSNASDGSTTNASDTSSVATDANESDASDATAGANITETDSADSGANASGTASSNATDIEGGTE